MLSTWHKCLLLSTVLYGTKHIEAIAERGQEIIYKNQVLLDDETSVWIDIYDGEEPADAVYSFGIQHGLGYDQRQALLQSICEGSSSKLECTRMDSVIWSTPVEVDDEYIATFDLYESEEPIDAAQDFVEKYELPIGYRNAILVEACEKVDCHYTAPVVWSRTVNIDEEIVEIKSREDEEVADSIFQALLPYNIPFQDRRRIFEQAQIDGVEYSREYALIYSKQVEVDVGKSVQLNIYDDGGEPIDAMYEFSKNESLSDDMFQTIVDVALPVVCGVVTCHRDVPIVFSMAFEGDDSYLGVVEVKKGEEPVDAVYHFIQQNPRAKPLVSQILGAVCKEVECTRFVPAVYTKNVNGENGKSIGHIYVLDGEEAVDGVVRFLRETNATIDEVAAKNLVFQEACRNPRVACTRNYGHIFDRHLNGPDGESLGRLIVTEHEEPADKVYFWMKENNISMDYLSSIIETVCEAKLARCERKRPAVITMPMTGPDNEFVGNYELLLDEEPVDALYRFFAIHGLFKKEWDFGAVKDQICSMDHLTCRRKQAVKFMSENFVMGNMTFNPFIVWEHQEVVDVLFELRHQYNFTLKDQVKSFSEICLKKEVHCERTHAVTYKLTDITKRDFAKFGNETCLRKYAGIQFVSTFAESYLGSSMKNLLENEAVETVIMHPLFCCILFWTLIMLTELASHYPHLSRKPTKLHKLVMFLYIFLIVSMVQYLFVEPKDNIDQAMHIHEGKLPDLMILEDEEPVDAVLKWGKESAKDHHPIVREPIHWDVLDKVCNEIKHGKCTRKRAWEYIDIGSITIHHHVYPIQFYYSQVDPAGQKECNRKPCILLAAWKTCERIYEYERPPNCTATIAEHIQQELKVYNSRRKTQKDPYKRLTLEMDAPNKELYPRLASIIRSKGRNMSPYSRVDNGTRDYHDWDKYDDEFNAYDSYDKIKDPESREWSDKPCTPYFGGALCGKHDKDGNLMIEV